MQNMKKKIAAICMAVMACASMAAMPASAANNAVSDHAYPLVESVEQNEATRQFRFSWSAVPGAEQYGIAVKIAGKWKIQKVVDANTTLFITPKLTAGKTYDVVVCAKINGEWDTSKINSRAFTVTVSENTEPSNPITCLFDTPGLKVYDSPAGGVYCIIDNHGEYLRGDVTGDGRINLDDVTGLQYVIERYNGKNELRVENKYSEFANLDVNSDYVIDKSDMYWLTKLLDAWCISVPEDNGFDPQYAVQFLSQNECYRDYVYEAAIRDIRHDCDDPNSVIYQINKTICDDRKAFYQLDINHDDIVDTQDVERWVSEAFYDFDSDRADELDVVATLWYDYSAAFCYEWDSVRQAYWR